MKTAKRAKSLPLSSSTYQRMGDMQLTKASFPPNHTHSLLFHRHVMLMMECDLGNNILHAVRCWLDYNR